MVILGGLEFVVGGYFVHKYYKNRKEEDNQKRQPCQRRQQSYPGAKPPRAPQQCNVQSQQQKFAYYAPQPQGYGPQPQPRPQTAQPPHQGRPYSAQPMSQPMPQQQQQQQQQQQHQYFQPQLQPLGRQQSFASLSNMPVANGRPQAINTNVQPPLPPRPQLLSPHTIPIQPSQGQWVNQPMYNPAFNASCPTFAQPPSTPTYQSPVAIYHVGSPQFGRNTTGIEDDWELEEEHNPHVRVDVDGRDPSEEEELDPPPPYRP